MFFVLDSVQRKRDALNHIWGLRGSPVMQVEIKEFKRSRSASQNRLYWSWVNIIGPEIGFTPDEMHEVFKIRLLGINIKKINGQEYAVPKSTTALGVEEFTTFLQGVESFAADLGIAIPTNDDDYSPAMGEKRAA